MTDRELKTLKDNLWHAADVLRSGAHLAANKYGQPILGLIFLRYADILFKQHKDEIEAEYTKRLGTRMEKTRKEIAVEKCGFFLPECAYYDYLNNAPDTAEKADLVKKAMEAIDREKLQVLLDHGADRISVNPQSLEPRVLSAIGRKHSPEDIEKAMELATSMGFPHVNMDLIAGLPADTPEGFRRTLDTCLTFGADNITVHTLSLKKGSRILLEGLPIPSAEDVAAMLDYADPALREKSFAPYYLYRQKYMSGSFENVGWCISGAEGLYNIYIMEELHSILSLGAGGSTKMVDAKRNRIERVFHPKFPLEYIQRPEKLTENLEAFRRFHQEMAR